MGTPYVLLQTLSPEWENTGLLLRDFFMFPACGSLLQLLPQLYAQPWPPGYSPGSLESTDWLEVEYDFNRLFVGPQALLAAPYASVWLETEPQLLGKTTLAVRQRYHALGVAAPQENQIPDDHIAYEIEACLLLARQPSSSGIHALTAFVTDHLAHWLPLFIERVKQMARTPEITAVAELLAYWFAALQRRTSR